MTTRDEIEQALRDLRSDEFVWRDDRGLASRPAIDGRLTESAPPPRRR